MKYSEEESQAGCMWGLVHVLYYHNVKKMIHHRKHTRGWTTLETSTYQNDAYEERLLDEKEGLHHTTKSRRATNKRSLRARLKALISDQVSKEDSNTRGFAFKPSLQRTYSIHHLESLDDGFNKICTDWKNQVLFLPKDADNASSHTTQMNSAIDVEPDTEENDAAKEDPDVFEIFKVNKELLLKNLLHSDKDIVSFSRSAFGLSTDAKFSKSRSFPVAYLADGRKLKPVKLEIKQREVWSFPKENKSQAESFGENVIRKRTNRRSFSLVESLDKYARLLENTSEKEAKLNSSKSLKLSNEHGLAPKEFFRRIHSLSYVDSDYLNMNFDVPDDNPSGKRLVVVENDSSSGMQNIEDENVTDDQNTSMNAEMQIEEDSGSSRKLDDLREQAYQLHKNSNGEEELRNRGSVSDGDFSLETTIAQISSNIEKDEIADKVTDKCPKRKNSDLHYVRHLLDQSGIAVDAAAMTWHSSEQPLSPQLFEELEGRWPHEQDELNGWPDFHGCWHHQMLFDLVNEALVEAYDVSLPYYPKALSWSCHVRPFPVGNCIVEEVCTSIGRLRDVKADEKQSLDRIVGRDLAWDHSWMNLQLETEFIALHLEDIIFNQLLDEVVYS